MEPVAFAATYKMAKEAKGKVGSGVEGDSGTSGKRGRSEEEEVSVAGASKKGKGKAAESSAAETSAGTSRVAGSSEDAEDFRRMCAYRNKTCGKYGCEAGFVSTSLTISCPRAPTHSQDDG